MKKNNFKVDEIERVIKKDNEEELISVIISLGRDCQNESEFEYALNHLIKLSNHKSSSVRASVILAFGTMITYGFKIDKKLLEPIILEIYNKSEVKDLANIEDWLEDINFHTNWNIKLYKK